MKPNPIHTQKDARLWVGADINDFLAAVMKGRKGCAFFFEPPAKKTLKDKGQEIWVLLEGRKVKKIL